MTQDPREARPQVDRCASATEDARLSSFLSEAAMPFCIARTDGAFIMANQAYERLIGYSQDELTAEVTWNDTLTPPEWRDAEAARIRQLLQTGGPERYEKQYIRKDGTRIDVTLLVHLVEAGDERLLYAFVEEIGERRRLEQELADASSFLVDETRRFEATFENAAVGIAHVGTDGSWLRTNRVLRDFLGYGEDELHDLTFADLTHPEDLDADLALAQQLHDGEIDSYSLEKRYRRKDGTYVWAQLCGSAVRADDGSPSYYVAVVEDIGKRKAAEQQAAEELQATNLLLEAVGALAQNLDLNEVCATLAEVTSGFTGRSRVLINLYDERARTLTVAASVNSTTAAGTTYELDSLPEAFGRCIESGRSSVIDYDGRTVSEEDRAAARGFRSLLALAVPIVFGERTVGVIAVDEPLDRTPFTDRQIALVEGVAREAAVAIKNAEHYGREAEIAQTLQEALMALPSDLPGVEFHALYRAASERARVGGDFIDAFSLPDGKVCFTLGDVSGKGLQAASITAAVRNTIRAHALSHASPAMILGKTNQALCHFTEPETFVTDFLGILDPATGMLTYANGGHPFPVAVGPDGDCRMLDGAETIVGAFPNAEYVDRRFVMPAGWSVFVCSDGVHEARREGEMFSEHSICDLLASAPTTAPRDLVDSVFSGLHEFTGGHFSDDIAMFAIQPQVTGLPTF